MVSDLIKSFGVDLVLMFERKRSFKYWISPGVPGQINAIFGALWRKLNVKAIYVGEDTKIYIDVSNIREAIETLSQEEIE